MPKFDTMSNEDMLSYIATSPDDRIYAIAQLIRNGVSLHEIFKATMITEYFLESFKKIVDYETTLAENVGNKEILTTAKKMGFSDQYIACLLYTSLPHSVYQAGENRRTFSGKAHRADAHQSQKPLLCRHTSGRRTACKPDGLRFG